MMDMNCKELSDVVSINSVLELHLLHYRILYIYSIKC